MMITKGREREMSVKYNTWKRLFSYYYKDLLKKSQIIQIIKENK